MTETAKKFEKAKARAISLAEKSGEPYVVIRRIIRSGYQFTAVKALGAPLNAPFMFMTEVPKSFTAALVEELRNGQR